MASPRIAEIMHAIDALSHNPLIGRAAANDKRELVLGSKSRGYVASSQYFDEIDTVFALAVRGRRDAGYALSGG
jgi:toxin ParE1/3/4